MEEASSGSQAIPGDGSAELDDAGEDEATFFQSTTPREQEMFLPIANISRIMRRVLPANAKITKEARESVQECVAEFIGFVTSEANDKCLADKRKTISGDDLIWAMATLGFENYVEVLKVYLHRYKELEGGYNVTVGSRCGPEPPLKKDEGGSANFPDGQKLQLVQSFGNTGLTVKLLYPPADVEDAEA